MSSRVTKLVPFRDMLDFVGRVKAMRDHQAAYVSDGKRNELLLSRSRSAERAIDRECAELLASQYATGSLFTPAEAVPPPVALLDEVTDCVRLMKNAAEQGGSHTKLMVYMSGILEARAKDYEEWK